MRLLLLLLLAATPAAASDGWLSFRCPATGNVLSLGATSYEVRTRCREPDDIVTSIETRAVTVAHHGSDMRVTRRRVVETDASTTIEQYVEVTVETWIYDFGSNRFLRILRFENGRLVSISHGERGAADPE